MKIDKWLPSTKTCSNYGQIHGNLTLSERVFECACGNKMDCDENAAINIENEGKRLLSETKVA